MMKKITLSIITFLLFQLSGAQLYDECANAKDVTPNSSYLCATSESGTLNGATQSLEELNCANKADNADDDVWFMFTATKTKHIISLSNISDNTDLYHTVYRADDCTGINNANIFYCSDDETSGASQTFEDGKKYYIRIFSDDAVPHTTTFDVCIGSEPDTPDNDDCSTATNVDDPSGGFSTMQDASSATSSSMVSGCATDANDGVWYKIKGNGNWLVAAVKPNNWNARIDVYKGICGTFECVGSSDSGGSNFAEGVIFSSNLNEDYYVNISSASGSYGTLTFTVSSKGLSVEDLMKVGFAYYPNPVTDVLKIESREEIKNLSVYNHMGQQLLVVEPSSLKTELNFSKYPAGAYFVRAYVGTNNAGTFKIIKR